MLVQLKRVHLGKRGPWLRYSRTPPFPTWTPASETQGHPSVQSPSQDLYPPCVPTGQVPLQPPCRALMTGAHCLGDSLFQLKQNPPY